MAKNALHTVSYRTGLEVDRDRLDWDGAVGRPLAWSAWYPAAATPSGRERPHPQFFDLGDVWADGAIADRDKFPVVMLSHGTGGSPESLGWLAHALAERGHIVIGPHHHGNTGREPYRAEGFLCWWERAADMSVLLSRLAASGPFAGRLDLSAIHAIGFSLGAYTALALAGARTSMDQYQDWVTETGQTSTGPREFPDLVSQVPHLRQSSIAFRESWSRQGNDFTEARIKSAIAIAPPPPVRAFHAASLQAITIPVTLITGEADIEAPSTICADWLVATNPHFDRISMGQDVGHYTFLGQPSGEVPEEAKFIFTDHPAVDRAAVHEAVVQTVLQKLAAPNQPG